VRLDHLLLSKDEPVLQASAQVSCIQRVGPDASGVDVPVIGALAQLGEHLLCKQGVVGSIPTSSTTIGSVAQVVRARP
jgi:hypothetical protein